VPQPPSETLEFAREEPQPLLERMAALVAEHHGWVNLRPFVHEDEDAGAPVGSGGLFGVFGGSGPPVPLCTWTPGEVRRRGIGPASIGIQHAAGPKVVRWLAEFGVPVPAGWAVTQDHPRRGLVVNPPPETPLEDVVAWLLAAGEALCRLPITGRWRAAVYA
jgi:hypothetical protein